MREGWEYKKLGEVCEVKDGTHDSPKYVTEGYPLITSKNLKGGILDLSDVNYISKEDFDNINKRSKVDIGDILFAMIGTIGNPIIVENEPIFAIKNMALFKPSILCVPLFIKHYFSSKRVLQNMQEEAKGVTQKFVSLSYLRNYVLPLPPLSTQQQIVSELDLLSHILDQKRQQLKEYDALAESIFYDMFGDPVENPKGWEVKNYGQLCNVCAGGDKSLDLSSIRDEDYKYPVIANGEGDKGILGYSKTFRISGPSVTIGSRGASVGNCRIVNEKFTPVVRLIALEPNSLINCQYLYFSAIKTHFKVSGAGQAQLTVPNVKEEKLLLPPLSLQQSFAEKIESIEHQKQLLKESIKETETLFQSRMDYWFNA